METFKNSETESDLETPRKSFVSIQYGAQGHEKEYLLMTRKNRFSEAQKIPNDWEQKISSLLGKDWSVMDREYRIEIMPPKLNRTPETDSRLMETLWLAIGSNYEFSEII